MKIKKTQEELLLEVENLKVEINKLKKQKRFGLVWEDKPEKFEKESENALPVLKEKGGKFKDVISEKGEDFNILIEGDNYHSLSVLNYTHRGKIDVIYIDPPYNTGNKDFRYNDYFVDKEDRFRHSKWLSFMSKRLKLAKNLLKQVKQYPETNYYAYFGSYLGNYFLILFFPEVWSYELFETYAPKAEWNLSDEYKFMTDYEPYEGRKKYAENCGGGYYAARLPILEKLNDTKRQGSVLTLRFITGEYAVPLGVWVVREAVRRTLKTRPLEFASKELMLKYANLLMKKKFNYNIDVLINKSILLNKIKTQRKLSDY